MTQWYPKEFSQLTRMSVRTLHHYDEIGLLKPSVRLANGYRLYAQADLLKAQQIIALKFFGFSLMQIKTLLKNDVEVLAHFKAQKKTLQNQVLHLKNAENTLDTLIFALENDNEIEWNSIVNLMEDYTMTRETEMIWGFDAEKQEAYQQELIDIGLATQTQIDECNERTKSWSKERVEKIQQEQDALFKAFTEAINNKKAPSDPDVQKLVQKHFENIKNFWTPTKESYTELGKFYCHHADFEKFFETYHPRLSGFLAQAMAAFAEREL